MKIEMNRSSAWQCYGWRIAGSGCYRLDAAHDILKICIQSMERDIVVDIDIDLSFLARGKPSTKIRRKTECYCDFVRQLIIHCLHLTE